MSKDTGGPAFPSERFKEEGMTLRDYFAAKAMQGLLACDWVDENTDIAQAAYEVADAMIKEREK